MKYLLGDVQHRRRLGSVECDVYVPKLNIGIEVDGLLWHKDTFAQDRRKELLLEDRGITLIRVRQEGLRRVSELDVFFSKRDSHLAVVKNIVRKMMERFPSDVHTNDAMGNYLKRDRMANEEEYKQLLYTLPSPSANLSFKAQYPKVAREWHPTKNGSLTPELVTPMSGQKVWWLCKKGHEWEAVISNRAKGFGCPYCAGQRATEENCLSVLNPLLSRQWHPRKNGRLTPCDVTGSSGKKVWWICPRGHEWKATVAHRASGNGCPYCSGRVASKDNCLLKANPALADEWHPSRNGGLTPELVTPRSGQEVWWLCRSGHEWQALIYNRAKGVGCPYCAGQKACPENCLQHFNPELSSEWLHSKNGRLTPADVTPGSNRKVWWICQEGHEWEASVSNRNRGTGCPYCSGRRAKTT